MGATHAQKPARERRFQFGRNWALFLRTIDPQRIARAERSLCEMLGSESLAGQRFLDIGCGSGLFSLAARRLGASVRSFDYDARSVACCRELRASYCPEDPGWEIEQGSALDAEYLEKLGVFEVVYSWGVLHHTGQMWRAAELAAHRTVPGGLLFVALYNDQGWKSRFWRAVKRVCVSLPHALQAPYTALVISPFEVRMFVKALWSGTLREYWASWTEYGEARGMSRWRDAVDWVGGYPFEAAAPPDVIRFYSQRGFDEVRTRLTSSHGCNEFVFRRRFTAEQRPEQGSSPASMAQPPYWRSAGP